MTTASGALTSRVGRRFVLLFAGSALVPLIAFAGLAVYHVSKQAEVDLQSDLHRHAKSAGMGLAARLRLLAGDLALANELTSPDDAAVRQIGDHCRSVERWTGERRTLIYGEADPIALELGASERAHLAAGMPLARFVGDPVELVMIAATDPDRPDDFVAARVRNEWFWDPQELRGSNCEFAAFDSHGRLVYDSFPATPPTAAFVNATRPPSSSGTFLWRVGGESYVARYWHAFLRPQYDLNLYVVQSRPEADATAIGDAFVRTFWLCAAATLLLVVFVSLVQIRRTLDPIVALRSAAGRLGRGDLDVRVHLHRNDEFGELGTAFDDMADNLQSNIEKRKQTERELVASRDSALAAVRAKATFLTNVSHELRTPMAEILGATEILTTLEETEVDAREEFSGIALHGAKRLAGLLDDVLALGDEGEQRTEPVDVGAAIAAATAELPADVQPRVTVDVPDDLPPTLGDAERLRETFTRLLDNAVKFSAADTPITVRAGIDGDRILIAVSDRGPGIDPADHERIFEPFCQVGRDQMVDKAGGTGLGLTLAKSVIERHGGTITVDSTPGAGATLRVQLPIHVTSAAV